MSDFNFFLPISKIDKARRTISGYATTPAEDLDGEIISLDAVKKALPGYMQWRNVREMHTASAVGVTKEANIDSKGLYLSAKIVDDAAWTKVVEGVYNGFSIGGKKLTKIGNTITELDLIEISVVDRPCNPECRFTVQKSASPDAEAYLLKLRAPRDRKDTALEKMAEAVQALTSAENLEASDYLDEFDIEKRESGSADSSSLNPPADGKKTKPRHELGLEEDETNKTTIVSDDDIFSNIEKLVKVMSTMDLTKAAGNVIKAARDNLKKAKPSMAEMKECVKALHAMHKAAFEKSLAKKAGSDGDADDMNHEDAMKMLQKTFTALSTTKSLVKAASGQLKKAAGGPMDSAPGYHNSAGVSSVTPELGDPMFQLDGPPTFKAAQPETPKTYSESDLKLAKLEAENEILKSLPAGPVHGRRPAAFNMNAGTSEADLYAGIDAAGIAAGDENAIKSAGAKLIGNTIMKGGKSVFDPAFKGAAGL